MKKAAMDRVIIDRIGQVLRVTRKHLGLNQTAIAPQLGLDQSALSRVESGKQMLTTVQWITFCGLTHISPDAAVTGVIELNQPESAIRLPARYAFEKHSKVRSLLPLLDYARNTLGERGFSSFLEATKIEEDYLLNLNAEINFNFTIDLAEALVKKTGMTTRDAESVTRTAAEGRNHGLLRHHYDCLSGHSLQIVNSFFQNASRYGSYFHHEVLDAGQKTMEVAVTPLPQLKEFQYRDNFVLKDFFAYYDKGYLTNLSAYGGQHPLKVTLLENHYKGAPRCIYRLNSAVARKLKVAA